jgi:quercetin dioxygenase-like cupin family protein
MIPDSNKPRDRATELAALQAAGVLDGEDVAAMAPCGDCVFGKAALSALDFETTAAAISSTVFPPVAPSAGLKDKIMARISPPFPETKDADTHFIFKDEGDWQTLPGGKIRLKTLSDLSTAGHAMILLEASPGAVFVPHFHEGSEEIFLISGDLTTNGRVLGPGDYLRHAAGTHHPKATSEHGCRAILVTARENHPRKAIGTYSELRNLVKGVLGS